MDHGTPAPESHPDPSLAGDPPSGRPRSGATSRRWPRYKNPWIWAFLIGCAVLTLMRPCTRHIPAPPGVTGPLPAWSTADNSSEALSGSVYAFGFSGGGAVVEAMAQADDAWTGSEKHVRGIVLDPAEVPDLVLAARGLFGRPVAEPWQLGLILVDEQGQCRGFYGTGKDGIDELEHRAVHIVRELEKP